MLNTGYSLLVIDDQVGIRKNDYRKVLEPEFDLTFVEHEGQLEKCVGLSYDACILDVVLRPDWATPSSVVLEEYLGRRNIPVFLLSGRWKTDDDVIELLREMAVGNRKVVDLLDWRDFASKKRYAKETIVSSLKVALDKWYRREGMPPRNSDIINLLHLSDTQIGDPAYSFVSKGVEEHIGAALEDLGGPADLVVCSGDVAYSGAPKEYREAEKWWPRLLRESLGDEFLGNKDDRSLVVPGNHDVDLLSLGSDSVEFDFSAAAKGEYPVRVVDKRGFSQRNEAGEVDPNTYPRLGMGLSSYGVFAENVASCWKEGNVEGGYVDKFIEWGVDFVLVSTAGLSSLLETQVVGVKQETLDRISEDVRTKRRARGAYRILVTHHPPPEILNADPRETAKWEARSWEAFRGWLGRIQPDLWLCGHTHMGAVAELGAMSGVEGIPCVVAPTLTLKQAVRGEDALRGFGVLSLEREGGEVKRVTVRWFDLKGSNKPKLREESVKSYERKK